MEDILDGLLGFNKKKEIIDLWYEVTFVRFILNNIMIENPEVAKCITKEMLDKTRLDAQEHVKNKFPYMGILFGKEAEEKKQKIQEELNEIIKEKNPNYQKFTEACESLTGINSQT